jgi:hypothetical protein
MSTGPLIVAPNALVSLTTAVKLVYHAAFRASVRRSDLGQLHLVGRETPQQVPTMNLVAPGATNKDIAGQRLSHALLRFGGTP